MATEFTVCIITEDTETLQKLKAIVDEYDIESKEITDMIENNQNMEYNMPVCIYKEYTEIEGSALWLEARRYCGDEFIVWLARKVEKQLVYAIYTDCGDDYYCVGIASVDGKCEIMGSVDAFEYSYTEEREIYVRDFLALCKKDA